jgi:hypothetical protein
LLKNTKDLGVPGWNDNIHAFFFIVEPSVEGMRRISAAVQSDGLKGAVGHVLLFSRAREAYDLGHSKDTGRGKVVLTL